MGSCGKVDRADGEARRTQRAVACMPGCASLYADADASDPFEGVGGMVEAEVGAGVEDDVVVERIGDADVEGCCDGWWDSEVTWDQYST